jgi:hypothetical protein
MRNAFILSSLLFLFHISASAQEISITGHVNVDRAKETGLIYKEQVQAATIAPAHK